MPKKKNHPMQPIEIDEHGIARFKANKIVRYLLDNGGLDLNKLYMVGLEGKGVFSKDDWTQFNQLIGYSVDGFGSLSTVSKKVVSRADKIAEKLWKESQKNGLEKAIDKANKAT
jgi:hypothetical protein